MRAGVPKKSQFLKVSRVSLSSQSEAKTPFLVPLQQLSASPSSMELCDLLALFFFFSVYILSLRRVSLATSQSAFAQPTAGGCASGQLPRLQKVH